jgi:PKD repeat protein
MMRFYVLIVLSGLIGGMAGCGGGAPRNQPPTVSLSADYTFIKAGLPVTFTAAASDADGTITGYSWDFGDTIASSGSAPTAVHTYTAQGAYTAKVTVSDDAGATASAMLVVTVTPAGGGPNVKLDSVDLEVAVANGPVSSIQVNSDAIAVGPSQVAVAPVALSSTTTNVAINTVDVAGNPAATFNMTITKTE